MTTVGIHSPMSVSFHIWARVDLIDDLHYVFVTAMPTESAPHPRLETRAR